MKHEKYLFWFRFQFPIDWINKDDHEVIELVFMIAKSSEDALNWGNKIAERYIENLFTKKGYHSKTIAFASFIWDGWEDSNEERKKELESFQIVNYGEYTVWDFENQMIFLN